MDKNNMTSEWGLSDRDAFFASFEQRETTVRVTEDAMEAWLYLAPKEDKEEGYTKEELLELLSEHGVCHGINQSNIAAMAKKKVYNREIKVAQATQAKPGKDGYYEFSVPEDETMKMPEIRKDGSVDYQSMSVLTNVKQGDVIARYHKAVFGVDGMDVFGREIPVPQVRELPPLRGKGVSQSVDNPEEYIAETDGKVDYKDGKLSILKVHEVTGDVDLVIGKIEFPGDIVISGNVSAGVTICAGKSLTIEGTVEAANLIAGGDIVLKRGIQGNHKGRVITKGNFYADFVEHAMVQAEKDVQANILLNSQIHSGGKVLLTGKKAAIIGGMVHADKGIHCKTLGNDVNVKTVVHAGCEQSIVDKYREITKEKNEKTELLAEMEEELIELLKKKRTLGNLVKAQEKRCEELLVERKRLKKEMEEIRLKTRKCNEVFAKCKDAVIRIEGDLFVGSVIGIDGSKLSIENNTCYMEYRAISGLIAGSVIVLH